METANITLGNNSLNINPMDCSHESHVDSISFNRRSLELGDDPDNFQRALNLGLEMLNLRHLQMTTIQCGNSSDSDYQPNTPAIYLGTYYPSVECWSTMDYFLVENHGRLAVMKSVKNADYSVNGRLIDSNSYLSVHTNGEQKKKIDTAMFFLAEMYNA